MKSTIYIIHDQLESSEAVMKYFVRGVIPSYRMFFDQEEAKKSRMPHELIWKVGVEISSGEKDD